MKSWRTNKNFKKAFTIVELLVVGAIFAAAIGSFFGASSISFRAVSKASDKVQAAFLMEEGLEGMRHLRDLSFTHYLSSEELGYERCLNVTGTGEGTELYTFATSTAEVVSRWHLDETSGSPVSNTSTTTNPGTFSGTATWVAGKFNNAASFNGSSYISTLLTPAQLKLTNTVTLEAWVKSNAGSGVRKIVGSVHDGGFCCPYAYTIALDLDTNSFPGFSITVNNTTWTTTLRASSAIDTNWHHIVGTYENTGGNSGLMKLYVDGKLSGTPVAGSQIPLWPNFPFYIGASHINTGYGEYFNGLIDEVVIYNRALTAAEVMDRYNGHAICRKPTLVDTSDGTSFTRTVKLENVCRVVGTGDVVAPPNDATTLKTAGDPCTGGTVDTQTKKATINVIWGPKRESIEKVEMYIANLFLN